MCGDVKKAETRFYNHTNLMSLGKFFDYGHGAENLPFRIFKYQPQGTTQNAAGSVGGLMRSIPFIGRGAGQFANTLIFYGLSLGYHPTTPKIRIEQTINLINILASFITGFLDLLLRKENLPALTFLFYKLR